MEKFYISSIKTSKESKVLLNTGLENFIINRKSLFWEWKLIRNKLHKYVMYKNKVCNEWKKKWML